MIKQCPKLTITAPVTTVTRTKKWRVSHQTSTHSKRLRSKTLKKEIEIVSTPVAFLATGRRADRLYFFS